MDHVKNNSFHILVVCFLSYSFFINKFVSNNIMISFGTKGLIPLIIIDLLFPFILLLYKPIKRIQQEKLDNLAKGKAGINFVFKIFVSVYLILTSIYTLRHVCSFMSTYFFNIVSLILEITLLLLLVLYASKKNFKCLNTISILIFFYFIFEFVVYMLTGIEKNYFLINLFPSFNTLEFVKIFMLSSLFFIDMLLLFIYSDDAIDVVKRKHLLLFAFLLSFMNIFEKVKMCLSLGPMMEFFTFPSFETWRLSSISVLRLNIDFIPLIGWIMLVFVRLSLSLYLLNKLWNNTSKGFNISILVFIGVVTYIISNNLEISVLMQKESYILIFIVGVVSMFLLYLLVKEKRGKLKRVK